MGGRLRCGDVGVVGISVVASYCGQRTAVHKTVRDILRRSCPSVRCVIISKTSGSGSLTIVGRCGGKVSAVVSRPSGNVCRTVGGKVHTTAKSVVNLVRSSSFLFSSRAVSSVIGAFRRRSTSVVCNGKIFMSCSSAGRVVQG